MMNADAASGERRGSEWKEWLHRRRRGVYWRVGAGLAMLLFAAAQWQFAASMVEQTLRFDEYLDVESATAPLRLVAKVVAITCALCSALVFLRALREHRLIRRVVETDGGVCPRCGRSMRVVDSGDVPPHLDARALRCARCGVARSAGEIRIYWEQTVVSPIWAREWRQGLDDRSRWTTSAARLRRFAQDRPIVGVAVTAPILLAILLAARMYTGSGLVSALVTVVPLVLLGAVAAIVASAVGRRMRPDQVRRCAECGYEQARDGVIASKCPECGAEWQRVGGTAVGRPVSRRGSGLMVGAVGIAMGLLFVGLPHVMSRLSPILPSPVLIATLGEQRTRDGEILAVLEARELEPVMRRRLLHRLVELRGSERYIDDAVAAALDGAFLDGELGSIDDGLLERFVAESIEARIDGPSTARVGESVRLRVEGEPRAKPLPLVEVRFAFGGWRIGDRAPIQLGDELHAGIRLWPKGVRSRSQGPPEVVFTVSAPGDVVVRADVWIVLDPTGVPLREVRWQDGHPALAAPPPLALHRMTLTHRLVVK